MNHVEAMKKELVWIRQFIHKKDDENVVIRDANGKDIASWIDRVDDLLATPPAAQQEPVAWAVFEGWNAHDLYLPQEYDEALKMAGYKGDHAEVKPLYTTPPAAYPEFECPRCGHCCSHSSIVSGS